MGIIKDTARALGLAKKPRRRKKTTTTKKRGHRLPPRNADGSFRKRRKG